ncbi:MAG: L-2-amino-thiazoline-4-carboxylic acid hydrolase [Thermoplasmata archaeon]|nr:MAG: L-2-amino-thiazoline-4-carboxylic acid hydrolase [Thermoplasmata archaeon]
MNEQKTSEGLTRRRFLSGVAPACSALCLGTGKLFVNAPSDSNSIFQQEKHPFEKEMRRKLTYRQLFEQRFNEKLIPILLALSDEIGKEKFLEILKKASFEDAKKRGQRYAQRVPEKSINYIIRPFRKPSERIKHSYLFEIIEDTEKAFEIKMTECIEAVIFQEKNAADLGYACICYADYGLPEGFNPKIKLIRDKTLMQGHDCCNHRYIWTG